MANSFSGLGDLELFPFEPSWADPPSMTPVFVRRIISQRGTVQDVESVTGDVPARMTLGFSLLSAEDVLAFSDFFMERKGRLGRFWLMHPACAFTLAASASLNQNLLVCRDNLAARQFQGYERIYLLMNDGDILIRQVTAVESDQDGSLCTLTLDADLDRVVTPDALARIGRVYLVRFDQDDLDFRFITPGAAGDVHLTFYELVKEYGDV